MNRIREWLTPVAGLLALVLTLGVFAPFLADTGPWGLLLAFPAVVATRSLQDILGEMKKLQDEHAGKVMPEDVGKTFAGLGAEAKAIQDEADRKRTIEAFEKFAGEVPDPIEPKQREAKGRDDQIVGYLPLGAAVTTSEEFKAYAAQNFPSGAQVTLVTVPSLHQKAGRQPLIPLTRKMREELESRLESKAVATIGADVIEPQRIADVVRATEQDELRLRDILNVAQTTSNAIEFVRIASVTRAAAPTAESANKPESTMVTEVVSTSVRTVAVWMPVTEQQLQDVPQLQNMIQVELLYDLRKVEEEQVMYGTGAGQNLQGILSTGAAVAAGRTVAGDSLIDKVRRAMTDIRTSGYAPNGVAIHPIDWEEIVLQKGTDEHYLYQVFPTQDGQLRVWGLTVVETVAAENVYRAVTQDRNIVVGDWLRGATLYDRMQAAIAVGWINDQFVKNMRTIRAEERLAFAVKRPLAFRKIQTVAGADV